MAAKIAAPFITVLEQLHIPWNSRWNSRLGEPEPGREQGPSRPAVFLDRDGVVVEEVGFVSNPGQLEVPAMVPVALKRLSDRFALIVVTNQSGIGRGIYTEEDLARIHTSLVRTLAAGGAWVDAIYYCPHHPEAATPEYRQVCQCRKPRAGMLFRAASAWNVNLGASFMVGDSVTDMEAARTAGVTGIKVGQGPGKFPGPEAVVQSLEDAAELILSQFAGQARPALPGKDYGKEHGKEQMITSKNVLVTGGAGYVGAVLVPKLLEAGHNVRVLDLYMYGDHVLDSVKDHPNLEQIKGDIRDRTILERGTRGCDSVIHLACISNDPSFELNPELGKSINYDAFLDLVDVSKESGVNRFIYASSSSVYGIKKIQNVTEELALEPLTDYSKYKAMCEDVLHKKREKGFNTLILRPATVCGYSPRLRLDLTVNILTNHAVNNRKITVFGGDQMRPNIHIEDVTDLYVRSLEYSDEAIDGKVFNAGYDNHSVRDIAKITQNVVGEDVEIVTTPTDDHRSYHISSEKIKKELGFTPAHSIDDAVRDLVSAFDNGKIPDAMTGVSYYNIKTMQSVNLK